MMHSFLYPFRSHDPIRFLFLTIIGLAFFSSPALAQQQNEEEKSKDELVTESLKTCVQLSASMKRLRCYDDTVKHFKIKEDELDDDIVKTDLDIGYWEIKKKYSDIEDSATIYMKLESHDTIKMQEKFIRPSLTLTCNPKSASVYTIWDIPLEKRLADKTNIVSRMDYDKAVPLHWKLTKDRLGAYHPKPFHFIKDLITKKKLLLKVRESSGKPHTVAFALKGLDNVIRVIRKDCGW